MLAERIDHDTAEAGVSLADCTTQAETDGHAYGVVIEVKTTSADNNNNTARLNTAASHPAIFSVQWLLRRWVLWRMRLSIS